MPHLRGDHFHPGHRAVRARRPGLTARDPPSAHPRYRPAGRCPALLAVPGGREHRPADGLATAFRQPPETGGVRRWPSVRGRATVPAAVARFAGLATALR
ncbi:MULTISPECIES: hypothetical protein [unclassified Streptomyces]|uniref:hypothetical protein n=1 Tax=unclassified Streptomyces TaxID=2593676 RepID=UPI00379E91A6